jgi:hypothetical protein
MEGIYYFDVDCRVHKLFFRKIYEEYLGLDLFGVDFTLDDRREGR